MRHACHALEVNYNLTLAAWIDVVCNKDITHIAVVALTTYIITRRHLTTTPCTLSLYIVLGNAIVCMVAGTIDIEFVTIVNIQIGKLEGAAVSVIDEHIVLRSRLYSQISQKCFVRSIVTTCIDTVGILAASSNQTVFRCCTACSILQYNSLRWDSIAGATTR